MQLTKYTVQCTVQRTVQRVIVTHAHGIVSTTLVLLKAKEIGQAKWSGLSTDGYPGTLQASALACPENCDKTKNSATWLRQHIVG